MKTLDAVMSHLGLLFSGFRRMKRLETRLDELRSEMVSRYEMLGKRLAEGKSFLSDEIERVRVEGHDERDSLYNRFSAMSEKGVETLEKVRSDLIDRLHASEKSCCRRVEEVAASLLGSLVDGNASLAGQLERVRVEGHAERDSLYDRFAAMSEKSVESLENVRSDLIDRLHAGEKAYCKRVEEIAATLSGSFVDGNASLAGQLERVRVEGHSERDSLYLRFSELNAKGAESLEGMRRELADALKTESVRIVKDLFRNDIRCRWQIIDALEPLLCPPDAMATCPICGHSDKRSHHETKVSECIFGGGRLERYVCPECGAVFGPLKMSRLSDSQLAEEYKQCYSVYSESDCTILERKAFDALNPKKDKKYLNYGAGAWNKTTRELRAAGYDVYDYEPYAPVEANPWVIRSRAELEKMRFDGIFSNDVIEHFKDPITELRAMAGLLLPGGEMVHCSGCYEYAFEYTRFHMFFLTGDSLFRLCESADLVGSLSDRLFDYSPARLCRFCKKDSD